MTAAIISRPPPPTPSHDPVKVLMVTHYFGGHGGGIELVAERLIQELAPSGPFLFTWAASNCDVPPVITGMQPLALNSCNLLERLFGLPWPLWGIKSIFALRKAVKSADVLWLQDTLFLGNILAFRMARKRRIPIMITQHLAPIPYRNRLMRGLMKLADKLFTTRMLRKADEVIFISDRVAEDYYRRVSFTRAIKVVPNGVDIRTFHPPIPENRRFLRAQFALKKDQPVFLFVGRFVEKKGLEVLRRLAMKLPSCRFWLAGDGPINPDYWLLPNVHVFRGKKGQSLAELYQTADLFLLPSYGEGFPLVIQEAMASGLPVLCGAETAQGCRPAIPFLYVADLWPEDPERTAIAWFDKIKTLPVRVPLEKMQDKSAEFAQNSWDWTPIAHVYADILLNLNLKR
jgi:glycosyltransferase involved in cell wall biosynthesis